MMSPVNFNSITSAGIAPVPKPPKAVSFTGVENVFAGASGAKTAATNFVKEKAVPFAKKVFEKVKEYLPKVKEYGKKAVQWAKDLNIPGKVKEYIPKVKEYGKKAVQWAKDLNIPGKVKEYIPKVKEYGKKAVEFFTNFVKKA